MAQKSVKISIDAFAALLKIRPGEVAWASKKGDLKGVAMPPQDRHNKYNLDDVVNFVAKYESHMKKFE